MAQVSDNFNRNNSATLGANWANSAGSPNPIQVLSNQATNTGGVFSAEVWNANVFGASQFSKYTVISVGDNRNLATVRAAVATNDLYGFGRIAAFDATHYVLFKTVSGSQTQLGSTSGTVVTANDVVELDVSGTTLTGIVNGVTLFTQTDSALSIANFPGLHLSDSGTAAQADNWSGGDLGGTHFLSCLGAGG